MAYKKVTLEDILGIPKKKKKTSTALTPPRVQNPTDTYAEYLTKNPAEVFRPKKFEFPQNNPIIDPYQEQRKKNPLRAPLPLMYEEGQSPFPQATQDAIRSMNGGESLLNDSAGYISPRRSEEEQHRQLKAVGKDIETEARALPLWAKALGLASVPGAQTFAAGKTFRESTDTGNAVDKFIYKNISEDDAALRAAASNAINSTLGTGAYLGAAGLSKLEQVIGRELQSPEAGQEMDSYMYDAMREMQKQSDKAKNLEDTYGASEELTRAGWGRGEGNKVLRGLVATSGDALNDYSFIAALGKSTAGKMAVKEFGGAVAKDMAETAVREATSTLAQQGGKTGAAVLVNAAKNAQLSGVPKKVVKKIVTDAGGKRKLVEVATDAYDKEAALKSIARQAGKRQAGGRGVVRDVLNWKNPTVRSAAEKVTGNNMKRFDRELVSMAKKYGLDAAELAKKDATQLNKLEQKAVDIALRRSNAGFGAYGIDIPFLLETRDIPGSRLVGKAVSNVLEYDPLTRWGAKHGYQYTAGSLADLGRAINPTNLANTVIKQEGRIGREITRQAMAGEAAAKRMATEMASHEANVVAKDARQGLGKKEFETVAGVAQKFYPGARVKAGDVRWNVAEDFADETTNPLFNSKYSIITAENANATAEEAAGNAAKNQQLFDELTKAGYKPIKVSGKYAGVPENSFIVPGMEPEEALKIGKKYNQQSVMTPYGLVWQDGTVSPMDLRTTKFGDATNLTEDYTEIPLGNGKSLRFQMNPDWKTKIPLEDAKLGYQQARQAPQSSMWSSIMGEPTEVVSRSTAPIIGQTEERFDPMQALRYAQANLPKGAKPLMNADGTPTKQGAVFLDLVEKQRVLGEASLQTAREKLINVKPFARYQPSRLPRQERNRTAQRVLSMLYPEATDKGSVLEAMAGKVTGDRGFKSPARDFAELLARSRQNMYGVLDATEQSFQKNKQYANPRLRGEAGILTETNPIRAFEQVQTEQDILKAQEDLLANLAARYGKRISPEAAEKMPKNMVAQLQDGSFYYIEDPEMADAIINLVHTGNIKGISESTLMKIAEAAGRPLTTLMTVARPAFTAINTLGNIALMGRSGYGGKIPEATILQARLALAGGDVRNMRAGARQVAGEMQPSMANFAAAPLAGYSAGTTGEDNDGFDWKRAALVAGAVGFGGKPAAREAATRAGKEFADFFSKATKGLTGKSEIPWKPIDDVSDLLGTANIYTNYENGNFTNHIARSIPTFRENQMRKVQSIAKAFGDGSWGDINGNVQMLDIAGSEGGFAKTANELSGGRIKVDIVDPNEDMHATFMNSPQVRNPDDVRYHVAGFGMDEDYYDDETGEVIKAWKPEKKYDIVHESMGFQFFSDDRARDIRDIKRVMNRDGVAIIEEKFADKRNPALYAAREQDKDLYKSKYFTAAELAEKDKQVGLSGIDEVEGMVGKQADVTDFEENLRKEFKYVEPYWEAGNFRGYIATDSEDAINRFRNAYGGTRIWDGKDGVTRVDPNYANRNAGRYGRSIEEMQQVVDDNFDDRKLTQESFDEQFDNISRNIRYHAVNDTTAVDDTVELLDEYVTKALRDGDFKKSLVDLEPRRQALNTLFDRMSYRGEPITLDNERVVRAVNSYRNAIRDALGSEKEVPRIKLGGYFAQKNPAFELDEDFRTFALPNTTDAGSGFLKREGEEIGRTPTELYHTTKYAPEIEESGLKSANQVLRETGKPITSLGGTPDLISTGYDPVRADMLKERMTKLRAIANGDYDPSAELAQGIEDLRKASRYWGGVPQNRPRELQRNAADLPAVGFIENKYGYLLGDKGVAELYDVMEGRAAQTSWGWDAHDINTEAYRLMDEDASQLLTTDAGRGGALFIPPYNPYTGFDKYQDPSFLHVKPSLVYGGGGEPETLIPRVQGRYYGDEGRLPEVVKGEREIRFRDGELQVEPGRTRGYPGYDINNNPFYSAAPVTGALLGAQQESQNQGEDKDFGDILQAAAIAGAAGLVGRKAWKAAVRPDAADLLEQAEKAGVINAMDLNPSTIFDPSHKSPLLRGGALNPINWNQRLNALSENNARLAVYLQEMERNGGNVAAARQRVDDILFNYDVSALSKAEQELRKFAPFYTFTRRNIPATAAYYAQHPTRAANILRLQQNLSAPDEDPRKQYEEESPYLRDQLMVNTGQGDMRNVRLPDVEALSRIGGIIEDPLKGTTTLARDLVAPQYQVLSQLLTGYDEKGEKVASGSQSDMWDTANTVATTMPILGTLLNATQKQSKPELKGGDPEALKRFVYNQGWVPSMQMMFPSTDYNPAAWERTNTIMSNEELKAYEQSLEKPNALQQLLGIKPTVLPESSLEKDMAEGELRRLQMENEQENDAGRAAYDESKRVMNFLYNWDRGNMLGDTGKYSRLNSNQAPLTEAQWELMRKYNPQAYKYYYGKYGWRTSQQGSAGTNSESSWMDALGL